jgi:chromate transporter
MMLSVSAIYVAFGEVPLIAGLLFGLKSAVLAVVLQALIRVSQKALGSPFMYVLAVVSFFAIFILQVPFPLIILGAATIGYLTVKLSPELLPASVTKADDQEFGRAADVSENSMRQTLQAIIVWGGIWTAALSVLMVFAPGQFASTAALFFSKTAAVTFGGAYAVLAFVGQQAVELYGWLSADDMLKGLGLAETTLGPLVLVLVFVGFLGGTNGGIGGLAGGLIAAFFTFIPCFLWIFAGAPYMERLRNLKWLSASLAAVTAAVVGVIANLAVWFGLSVMFGELSNVQFGILSLPTISIAQFDWVAAIIALGSGVALLGFKLNLLLVLAVAALSGVFLSLT